jgi:uncharacterized membrane protein YvbJ
MAFCTKCGTQLADGAKFCASCGTSTGETASESKATAQKESVSDQPPVNNTAGVKEKLNTGRKKINAGINKLPFKKLAENKIPAGVRAKVPLLEKAIPFANQIVCGLAVLLVVIIIAASGGGGPKALAKQSYQIKVAVSVAVKAQNKEKMESLQRQAEKIGEKVEKLSESGQRKYYKELERLDK